MSDSRARKRQRALERQLKNARTLAKTGLNATEFSDITRDYLSRVRIHEYKTGEHLSLLPVESRAVGKPREFSIPKYLRPKKITLPKFKLVSQNVYGKNVKKPPRDTFKPDCNCWPEDPKSYCTNCENALTYIECDPDTCLFGETCKNQNFQRQRNAPATPAAMDGDRGWGLIADADIAADTFIVEYAGRIVTQKECQDAIRKITAATDKNTRPMIYFLYLEGDLIIDACKYGTNARFINHSCNPNCKIEKWKVDGLPRAGVFAAKDIKKGEELTFDYAYEQFENSYQQACMCNSANCTGIIGGATGQGSSKRPSKRKKAAVTQAKKGATSKSGGKNDPSKAAGDVKRSRGRPPGCTKQKRTNGDSCAADGDVDQSSKKRCKTNGGKRHKRVWDSECFQCNDGGDLVMCDFEREGFSCYRAYHVSCIDGLAEKVELDKELSKKGRPSLRWDCPWHDCDVPDCNKKSVLYCNSCPSSWCKQHTDNAWVEDPTFTLHQSESHAEVDGGEAGSAACSSSSSSPSSSQAGVTKTDILLKREVVPFTKALSNTKCFYCAMNPPKIIPYGFWEWICKHHVVEPHGFRMLAGQLPKSAMCPKVVWDYGPEKNEGGSNVSTRVTEIEKAETVADSDDKPKPSVESSPKLSHASSSSSRSSGAQSSPAASDSPPSSPASKKQKLLPEQQRTPAPSVSAPLAFDASGSHRSSGASSSFRAPVQASPSSPPTPSTTAQPSKPFENTASGSECDSGANHKTATPASRLSVAEHPNRYDVMVVDGYRTWHRRRSKLSSEVVSASPRRRKQPKRSKNLSEPSSSYFSSVTASFHSPTSSHTSPEGQSPSDPRSAQRRLPTLVPSLAPSSSSSSRPSVSSTSNSHSQSSSTHLFHPPMAAFRRSRGVHVQAPLGVGATSPANVSSTTPHSQSSPPASASLRSAGHSVAASPALSVVSALSQSPELRSRSGSSSPTIIGRKRPPPPPPPPLVPYCQSLSSANPSAPIPAGSLRVSPLSDANRQKPHTRAKKRLKTGRRARSAVIIGRTSSPDGVNAASLDSSPPISVLSTSTLPAAPSPEPDDVSSSHKNGELPALLLSEVHGYLVYRFRHGDGQTPSATEICKKFSKHGLSELQAKRILMSFHNDAPGNRLAASRKQVQRNIFPPVNGVLLQQPPLPSPLNPTAATFSAFSRPSSSASLRTRSKTWQPSPPRGVPPPPPALPENRSGVSQSSSSSAVRSVSTMRLRSARSSACVPPPPPPPPQMLTDVTPAMLPPSSSDSGVVPQSVAGAVKGGVSRRAKVE